MPDASRIALRTKIIVGSMIAASPFVGALAVSKSQKEKTAGRCLEAAFEANLAYKIVNGLTEHPCEYLDIFVGGRFWTTISGPIDTRKRKKTFLATQHNFDAITTDGYPALVHRVPRREGVTDECIDSDDRPTDEFGKVWQCDEYPFASNREGGTSFQNIAGIRASLRLIPAEHNLGEGNALSAFYGKSNGCDIETGSADFTSTSDVGEYLVLAIPGDTLSTPPMHYYCGD